MNVLLFTPYIFQLIEKYFPDFINELNNIYYWTDKEGGSYHLNRNCPIIKNRNNIEFGTLDTAQKKKKCDPCDFCVFQ